MTETGYHDVRQPYRIQKRLALNQCFRTVQENWGEQKQIGYVTFGGEDLYDAMDLVGVFSIREHDIAIVSYEHDQRRAEASQSCAVATTLSQVETITIDIVPTSFPVTVDRIQAIRRGRQMIYFLDHTGTFREKEAAGLDTLLDAELLRAGDFLLVTSCLTPRVMHNANIMAKYDRSFRLMFGARRIDNEFRGRNHVDLFIALALSRRAGRLRGVAHVPSVVATLLAKFKYRDTRAPMGLWLYRIDQRQTAQCRMSDVPFDEFPHAFGWISPPAVPEIFD